MPLPLLAIAAAGFATGGGLEGIIGGKRRREEHAQANQKQAEAEHNYFNFDFNQDVGPIKDIYADQAQQTDEYLTRQADQRAANSLGALQQGGRHGAAAAILQQQNDITQRNAQSVQSIRQAGAQFVENQRQARISQKYDQAGTLLGRADNRLAAAKKARQIAQQKLIAGIGAGVTAGVGAGVAGGFGTKGFDWKAGLKGSGLIPSQLLAEEAEGEGAGLKFNKFQNVDFGTIG